MIRIWGSACSTVSSSPIASPSPTSSRRYKGYVRGTNSQLTEWDPDSRTCTGRGGTLYSAPTMPVGSSEHAADAFYKGANSKLYYYNAAANHHTSLGITLP